MKILPYFRISLALFFLFLFFFVPPTPVSRAIASSGELITVWGKIIFFHFILGLFGHITLSMHTRTSITTVLKFKFLSNNLIYSRSWPTIREWIHIFICFYLYIFLSDKVIPSRKRRHGVIGTTW